MSGGAFSDLYRGSIDRESSIVEVALKRARFLGEQEARWLESEGAISLHFSHPNLLPCVGVLRRSERTYLVFPWMECGDLDSFLTGRQRFFELPALIRLANLRRRWLYARFDPFAIVYGIARGLAYLHGNDMLHGDLTSKNVLLDRDLHPRISDFGLSKPVGTDTSSSKKGMGTGAFQAPELMLGGARTKASDVYAFGMLIGQVLSGCVPFHGMCPAVVILAVIQGRRPALDCSPQGSEHQILWDIASRCWNHEPSQRPSADDIVMILQRNGAT